MADTDVVALFLLPNVWLGPQSHIFTRQAAGKQVQGHLPLIDAFTSQIILLPSCFPSTPDNTAWILTRRSGFRQHEQNTFYLPILIADSGRPMLSSTGTVTIHVCSCDEKGLVMSCNAEAYVLPVSLSRGALIAILACIFVLLGKYMLWGKLAADLGEQHRMIGALPSCSSHWVHRLYQ